MILSFMAHYQNQLTEIFQALADPTRRAVIGRLGQGEASISDLAAPFEMALPSFLKHIRLLEGCGLIETRKQGRVRTCRLDRQSLKAVDDWLGAQRALWETRTDRLEAFLAQDQETPA